MPHCSRRIISPGKIYMKFEQLDGDGKAKSRNELWLELAPGKKRARLVKAAENGKDTTSEELEKERKRKEKGKGKNEGQTISVSAADIVPLLTNVKKPVAHRFLGRETKNGVECNAYEFRKEFRQKRGKRGDCLPPGQAMAGRRQRHGGRGRLHL